MGCISSSAELMQGDYMNVLNVALGTGWCPQLLWILMTLFYILDLPSGETQHKGT